MKNSLDQKIEVFRRIFVLGFATVTFLIVNTNIIPSLRQQTSTEPNNIAFYIFLVSSAFLVVIPLTKRPLRIIINIMLCVLAIVIISVSMFFYLHPLFDTLYKSTI